MQRSAKLVALSLVASSLSVVLVLPASAEPVAQCSNPSGNTITSKCVTDTNDVGNHKISKESWAEQQQIRSIAQPNVPVSGGT